MDSLTPIPTKVRLIFFLHHFPQSQLSFQVLADHFYWLCCYNMFVFLAARRGRWVRLASVFLQILSFLQWRRYCREHLSITFSVALWQLTETQLCCAPFEDRDTTENEMKCNSSARGQILHVGRLQKSGKSWLPRQKWHFSEAHYWTTETEQTIDKNTIIIN